MGSNNTVISLLVIPYNHAFPPVKLNAYSKSEDLPKLRSKIQ